MKYDTLTFVFWLAACIAMFLAMVNVTVQRISLMALGLLLFFVPFLIAAWPGA